MKNEFVPLISAAIGGGVALVVVFVNQTMEHLRWKDKLKRRGEDKYLDKKIEILHESNVEFFQLANDSLRISNLNLDAIKLEFKVLNENVRKRIALCSPYIDNELNWKIQSIYELLTNIRLILNKEIEGTEKEVITKLLWLNEALWEVRDDITSIIKQLVVPPYKSIWGKGILLISILTNILLTIILIF
ncbi:hypothetical protein QCI47_16180 [Bacillus cereus group sp. RP29]|uniref:hypothetical protein n=1 Tax=unclassified Bacillus cereus group TaxID=2750818 RepID=UPI0022E359B4|nr:hypothetical protein [Bacillus cereus group sp. BcHK104]MDA1989416.1 hypothetical protein [Bacillus cereus group sp. BcHK104]